MTTLSAMTRTILYLLTIVTANVLTAKFAPMDFGAFLVPVGTLFIGANFVLRDLLQEHFGRVRTYVVIIAALVISGITSTILGDPLNVLLASALAFAVSESTDTEIYSRMTASLPARVFASGAVGGTLDSILFVIVGLSPIGAGFLSWEVVPAAIIGQIIVKLIMQAAGAGILAAMKRGAAQ